MKLYVCIASTQMNITLHPIQQWLWNWIYLWKSQKLSGGFLAGKDYAQTVAKDFPDMRTAS